MRAADRLARRVELVDKLTDIDAQLVDVAAQSPSNRIYSETMRLLGCRRDIRSDMRAVGYEPWPVPLDLDEAKVV